MQFVKNEAHFVFKQNKIDDTKIEDKSKMMGENYFTSA